MAHRQRLDRLRPIRLNIADAHALCVAEINMLAIAPRTGVPDCVLVVEDEVLVRIGVAEALRDAGLHVIEAGNAQEALAVLHSRPEVALVLSDIRMPGEIDGIGLAQIINDRFQHLKVILTSVEPPRNFEGLFIAKPYDLDYVVASVTKMLD
jgi:two-component system, response regulator PdtaR